jgi:hypothetical protein
MTHEVSLQSTTTNDRKGDTLLAARDARVRARLAETHPILAAYGVASLERLFDYSTRVDDDHDYRTLRDAAENVLAWVQIELAKRPIHEALTLEVATELHFAQLWARRAHLEQHADESLVKEFELWVSDGAPRTICWGTSHRFRVDDDLATRAGRETLIVTTYASGCLCVFADATQNERKRWWYWCDRHQPSKARLARRWELKVTRQLKEHAAQRASWSSVSPLR